MTPPRQQVDQIFSGENVEIFSLPARPGPSRRGDVELGSPNLSLWIVLGGRGPGHGWNIRVTGCVSQSVSQVPPPPSTPRCLSEVLLYFSPVWRLLRYGPGHSRAWAAIEIEDLIICLISSIICPLHWADWYFVIPHIASLLPGPALYCIIDQSNWNSSLYAEFK